MAKKLNTIAGELRAIMAEKDIVHAIKNREIKEIEDNYPEQQNYPQGVFVFSPDDNNGILFGNK